MGRARFSQTAKIAAATPPPSVTQGANVDQMGNLSGAAKPATATNRRNGKRLTVFSSGTASTGAIDRLDYEIFRRSGFSGSL
jgi:hypothetical protein